MISWRHPRGGRRQPEAVHRHARRVALLATIVAGAIYVGAAAIGDVVDQAHLEGGIDARLGARVVELARSVPASGVPVVVTNPAHRGTDRSAGESGDLDDAPIFSWWLPKGRTGAVALQSDEPALVPVPPGGGASDGVLAGHPFRFHQKVLARGTLVVGTSTAQLGAIRTTLLVIEGSFLPVVLLLIYAVATVIGRGAAAPIERARREQLDFTADASHELRTPLAVIEAEVGLALASQRDAESYRGSLERVAGESKRLTGIVEELLWLARLDALPVPPPREFVDLGALAEQAAGRFGRIAAARSITLTCWTDGAGGPFVVAPADWLDRLVSVLLDNACRYASNDGSVGLTARSEGTRSLLVVEDSGPGFGSAETTELVRRFHRASEAPGGAGLGLSIAETIVRETGATWTFGRAPAGGARIEVSWPAPPLGQTAETRVDAAPRAFD